MADKKIIVFAALAVVIVAVGVFQFTRGAKNEPRPNPKAPAKSLKTAARPPDPVEKTATPGHAAADPFVVPQEAEAAAKAAQAEKAAAGKPASSPGPRVVSNGPWPPVFTKPLPGDLPQPSPGAPNPSLIPKPAPPKPSGWELIGVMLGPKPVAVLRGDDGRQIMVAQGQSISGTAVLVRIGPGYVVIRHRSAGTKTLRVGGGVSE